MASSPSVDINPDEWITPTNECFEINLTRPTRGGEHERIFSESFSPRFTYSVLTENEQLLGYKDPRIELDFRANDMHPSLKVQYATKMDLRGLGAEDGPVQVDLDTVFNEHFPAYVTDASAAAEEASSASDATSKQWKPPGALLHCFALHGKQYEIWSASMADPAAKKLFQNMQILTQLFIEGAERLELDEQWSLERWTLYLLYEVTPIEGDCSPYTLAGFSTSYRYWIFPTLEVMRCTKALPSPPDSTNGDAETYSYPKLGEQDPETHLFKERVDPLEEPSRDRISQFLILPPYQGQSLGARLYEAIFADLVKRPHVYEIPVEDPSDAFDAMRDYSDIVYLRSLPAFQALSLPSTLAPEKLRKDAPIPRDEILGCGTDLEALQHRTKIVARQFNRMLELHLLSTVPKAHRNRARITRKDKSSNEWDRKYYFWRLALKDRVYQRNAEALEEVADASERVAMLEQTVDEIQKEYEERLEGIERRAKWNAGENGARGEATASGGNRSKRKRVVVEDEDEEEDGDQMSVASSKKARV